DRCRKIHRSECTEALRLFLQYQSTLERFLPFPLRNSPAKCQSLFLPFPVDYFTVVAASATSARNTSRFLRSASRPFSLGVSKIFGTAANDSWARIHRKASSPISPWPICA